MIDIDDIKAVQGDFTLRVKGLTLKDNGLVAVLGNNGSGKSTFLSVLIGLKDFNGLYQLGGKDFNSLSPRDSGRVFSFLPQSVSLNMPFDVFYVVLTGRFAHTDGWRYSKADHDSTERVIERLDIAHLRDRQFNELSGGEKQRVLLARTLNKDTPVILLDEPFSNTDILHQHKLVRLIKQLAEEKLILVVIHDLPLAIREFDRFLFFESGTLSYNVPKAELKAEKLSRIFGVSVKFIKHEDKIFVYTEE